MDNTIKNIHGADGVGTVLDNVLFLEPWKFPRLHLFEAVKDLKRRVKPSLQ